MVSQNTFWGTFIKLFETLKEVWKLKFKFILSLVPGSGELFIRIIFFNLYESHSFRISDKRIKSYYYFFLVLLFHTNYWSQSPNLGIKHKTEYQVFLQEEILYLLYTAIHQGVLPTRHENIVLYLGGLRLLMPLLLASFSPLLLHILARKYA